MTPEQVASIVGTPYAENGFGPDSFNCWGLLLFVQRNYFGKDLPLVPIGNAIETRRIHNASLDDGLYALVDVPEHGDAVLLRGGLCPHVGVWLDIDGGGVLHSQGDIGVIWTPKARLNSMGYSRRTFYRIAEHARTIYPDQRPVPPDD